MGEPVGRPTDYNEQTSSIILERLSDGESLREICLDETLPARSTVFRWLSLHKEFSDQYAYAREVQGEYLFDEIIDIADNGTNDWMERNGTGSEGWKENGEALQRSKLRVDARKWAASKLLPKKYGDKTTFEHGGINGGAIKVATLNVDPKMLSDSAMAEFLAATDASTNEG